MIKQKKSVLIMVWSPQHSKMMPWYSNLNIQSRNNKDQKYKMVDIKKEC